MTNIIEQNEHFMKIALEQAGIAQENNNVPI
jgi:hypothetical protein